MKKETINLLNNIYYASEKKGKYGKSDYFLSRVIIAKSEPGIMRFFEKLIELMGLEISSIREEVFQDFLNNKECLNDYGAIRKYTSLVALAAAIYDVRARLDAASAIPDAILNETGNVASRNNFDIELNIKMLSPLAHGSDVKSGNTQTFRRMQVFTEQGGLRELPYYSGNAVRGIIRRELARHFLSAMGYEWSDAKPVIQLWWYYILTCGGSIAEKQDSKTTKKFVGSGGVLNLENVAVFRAAFPQLSALGFCLSDKIFHGMCMFNDLRPNCIEWGTGTIPCDELTTYDYLVRHDDRETFDGEYTGMIAQTEVLKSGTILKGGVDFQSCATELEKSAIIFGLELLKKRGWLGASNRMGFGKCEIEITSGTLPDSSFYLKHLEDNKQKIKELMKFLEASVPQDVKTEVAKEAQAFDLRSDGEIDDLRLEDGGIF